MLADEISIAPTRTVYAYTPTIQEAFATLKHRHRVNLTVVTIEGLDAACLELCKVGPTPTALFLVASDLPKFINLLSNLVVSFTPANYDEYKLGIVGALGDVLVYCDGATIPRDLFLTESFLV